jgi:hypothetical protein
MKVYPFRFNIYLLMFAALTLCSACHTTRQTKEDKAVSALRIHIESNVDPSGTSQTVSVLRVQPVSVTIVNNPVLTEANILAARVMDAPAGDGFAVELKFDETGGLMLEQYSASNPGKHFVIFGQWGEKGAEGRWLAAPLITHRITNGLLSFTPDMSHDEACRLVLGLNNVSKQVNKGTMK